ncbi:MAG: DivIVA domain-containing protein [Atopobiaceae bacterium]|nr:DivIVA domain-containing protein [Atopobiaceae bacterium]
MAITPADIEQLTFSPSKHGYNTEEVDAFLDQIASEVDAMLNKIADLKGRLNSSEQQLAASQAQVAQLREQGAAAAAAAPAPSYESDYFASERQISQVLIVAQQSADNLLDEARSTADKIRTDAETKAREVIRQALAEKQSELDEIDRLKQSREDFRTEYKKLLQHFIDDADAVFPQATLSTPNGSAARESAAPAPVIPTPAPAPAATPAGSPDATVLAPVPTSFDDFGDLD